MHHQTPYGAGAYRAVGIETGVDATDPLGLVVMLYDGAIQAIFRAEHHLSMGEIEARGRFTSRAIDIVNQGLVSSLDRKVGGELADSLASLYDYISRRLFDANLKGDAAIYAEVRALLGELRESWSALRRSKSGSVGFNPQGSKHNGLGANDRVPTMGRSLAA
jgi:flagellar protein FliS